MKFESIGTLAAEVKYVIANTFLLRNKKRSPENEFVSLNYDCCTVVDLKSKEVEFAYEELTFSKGRMMPLSASATFTDEDKTLTFTVNGDMGINSEGCRPDDMVEAVVVNTKYRIAVSFELGTRGEGGMKMQTLNALWKKEDLQVYVYARNASGTDVSPSTYVPVG